MECVPDLLTHFGGAVVGAVIGLAVLYLTGLLE
jgi:hypothetical protein